MVQNIRQKLLYMPMHAVFLDSFQKVTCKSKIKTYCEKAKYEIFSPRVNLQLMHCQLKITVL
jgi:hypothetical protein